MWMMIQRHPESIWNAKRDGKVIVTNDENRKNAVSEEAYYASLTDANVSLTAKGDEQMARSTEFLENLFSIYAQHGEVKAYSTPQRRGEQAGTILVDTVKTVKWAKSGQPEHPCLEVDHRLCERDFGEWAGMTAAEVEDQYRQQADVMKLLLQTTPGVTAKQLKIAEDMVMGPLDHFKKLKNDKKTGGFHAQPPQGETIAMVANRTKDFGGTIARQRSKGVERFFIETHGIVCRVLPITFMKKHPYTSFLREKNPGNTAIRLITNEIDGTGYKDHGYIYDPSKGIDCTKKPIKDLEKYLF